MGVGGLGGCVGVGVGAGGGAGVGVGGFNCLEITAFSWFFSRFQVHMYAQKQ